MIRPGRRSDQSADQRNARTVSSAPVALSTSRRGIAGPRPGIHLGASAFADRLGPQYRVVVVGHVLLAAADQPQLGADQYQRVTLTTTLREADRDAAGALRYRVEVFDQRLPFTWQVLASFRLPHADPERARRLLDALAAAIAAGALDPNTADFDRVADLA